MWVSLIGGLVAAENVAIVGHGFTGISPESLSSLITTEWTFLDQEKAIAGDYTKAQLEKVKALISTDDNTTTSFFSLVPDASYVQFAYTGVSDSYLAKVPTKLTVTNCHQSAVAIAEYVLANIFAAVVNVRAMDKAMRNCTWKADAPGNDCVAGQHAPAHRQITDGNLTVGIIGYGSIGSALATRASAVGLRVIGTTLDPPSTPPAPLAWLGGDADNRKLVQEADFVVIACPLTNSTLGLVDSSLISSMKQDAWLINIARGAIVDETALWNALQAPSKIGGAVLDVWWNSIFGLTPGGTGPANWPSKYRYDTLPNVIMSAHTSSTTQQTLGYSAACVASNLDRFAAGKPLINVLRNGTFGGDQQRGLAGTSAREARARLELELSEAQWQQMRNAVREDDPVTFSFGNGKAAYKLVPVV